MRQAVEDLATGAKEPRWTGHAHVVFSIIPSACFHGSTALMAQMIAPIAASRTRQRSNSSRAKEIEGRFPAPAMLRAMSNVLHRPSGCQRGWSWTSESRICQTDTSVPQPEAADPNLVQDGKPVAVDQVGRDPQAMRPIKMGLDVEHRQTVCIGGLSLWHRSENGNAAKRHLSFGRQHRWQRIGRSSKWWVPRPTRLI